LDAESGRFAIDQSLVDIHIEKLQRQLQDKATSIFSWVQAWNTCWDIFHHQLWQASQLLWSKTRRRSARKPRERSAPDIYE
jgi:hypothetical protein